MVKKNVLITGSSKGLGKQLALHFAAKGYEIILHGRNRKDLIDTKKKVVEKGVECSIVRGDVKEGRTIGRLYQAVRKKNVEVFINNAALECPHLSLEDISDKQIKGLLVVNLIASLKLIKRIYSFFKKRNHGDIVIINSKSGLEPQKLRSVYCASKWGLRGFTQALRLEAPKSRVRVIDVYPGRIRTKPQFKYGLRTEEAAARIFSGYEAGNVEILI